MNKKSSKLLAAVAVFAMVFAVFAAVPTVAEDSNADWAPADTNGVRLDGAMAKVESFDALKKFNDNKSSKYSTITKLYIATGSSTVFSITENISLTIPVVVEGTQAIDIASGKTVTIDVDANIDATNEAVEYYALSSTGALTVTGDGTLTINMGGKVIGGNSKDDAIASAIYSSGGNITLTVANLNIDVTTEVKVENSTTVSTIFGVTAADGCTETFGTTTAGKTYKVNISVNENVDTAMAVTCWEGITFNNIAADSSISGGNRAVYSVAGEGIKFNNSTMTLTGGEKAATASSTGTITLVGSTITAAVGEMHINHAGGDQISGVKAANLYVDADSKLYTDGAYVATAVKASSGGSGLTGLGLVEVRGGYTQNPIADLDVVISGLYYKGSEQISAVRGSPTATSTGIYLTDDAETYGNIAVTGDKKEGVFSGTVTGQVIETNITNYDKLTVIPDAGVTASGNFTVPVKKEVTLDLTTNAYTGTITTGTDTTNSVALAGYNGVVSIKEGSVYLEGKMTGGTITVTGEVRLNGTFEIEGGTLIIGENSVLKLNGNTLKAPTVVTSNTGDGIYFSTGAKIQGPGSPVFTSGVTIDSSLWVDEMTVTSTAVTFSGTTNAFGTVTVSSGTIQGTFNSGTLVIDGDVTIGSNLTIGKDAKVTVKNDVTLAISSNTLENNGIINVYGQITLNRGTFTNNGTIVLMSENAKVPATIGGTGTLDAGAVQKSVYLSGDIKTTEYGIESIVTIDKVSTLLKGTQLKISGTLIIAEGITLTISDDSQLLMSGSYAKLINNGTIVIESDVSNDKNYTNTDGTATTAFAAGGGLVISGGNAENNGTIDLAYSKLTTDVSMKAVLTSSAVFVNDGDIAVQVDNKLDITAGKFTNKDAVVVYGMMTASTFMFNEGTVIIDGTVSGTVKQAVAGATVQIVSAITGGSDFEVNDSEIVLKAPADSGSNSFKVNATANYTVSGITIISETVKEKNASDVDTNYRNMIISGSVSAAATSAATGTEPTNIATITLNGARIYMDDAMDIGNKVTLTGATSTILEITGTMTAQKESTISNVGIVVTGSLTMFEKDIQATKNVTGAGYVVKITGTSPSTTYYYTTLDLAIAGAQAASVNTVDLYGNATVSADTSVPAGMTLKQNSGVVTIEEGVTVTVLSTGKLEQKGGSIIVNGALVIDDRKTGLAGTTTITSDVKSEGEKDVRYTSLAGAIAAAGSTETVIKLSKAVEVKSALVIPSNVTVDTNSYTLTAKGAKITIDGVLFINGNATDLKIDYVGTTVKVYGEIVVNGYIKSGATLNFNGTTLPAGVYYSAGVYNYITALPNATKALEASDDNVISVYGKVSAGDLAFTGTKDKVATINVVSSTTVSDSADFTAGTITLDNAVISFSDKRVINATIAGANGSVVMEDVQSNAVSFAVVEDSDGEKYLTVTGGIVKIADKEKTYALVTEGDVVFAGVVLGVVSGTNPDKTYDSLVVDGNLVIAGTTASDLKNVLINGTLGVDNAANCAFTDVTVLGTFEVAAATASENAGNVTSIGKLYVGVTGKNFTEMPTTGTAATVSGAMAPKVVYVANGATVPAEITKDMKSIVFHVEDSIWFTAYASTSATTAQKEITLTAVPIANVDLNGWSSTADLKTLVKDGDDPRTKFTIGTDAENLYAIVDYNVYTVLVITDGGIASVAIDGTLLQGTMLSSNTFGTTDGLKAGQHTLTYTLKSGYEGTAVMYIDGKAVSGYTFELSGDDRVLTINLSGTAPASGKTESSGMSLTEILLIVLVVLIAVMAIVIAMRMMRS